MAFDVAQPAAKINSSPQLLRVVSVALCVASNVFCQPPRALPTQNLNDLLAREWEYELRQDPQLATAVGDRRYNSLWKDYSISAENKRMRDLSEWLGLFNQVDPKTLDEEGRLNRDLILLHLREWLTGLRWKTYETPINPHSGVHLEFVEIASVTPFDNASDYAAYLERLRALPKVMEDLIGVLEQGKKDRLVPFRHLIEQVIPQCLEITNTKGMDSPFSRPVAHFPDSMPEHERVRWRHAILTAIDTSVGTAYTNLAHYLAQRYLPFCQREPGLWALPDGDARYRFAIERMTTTKLDPNAIHKMGLQEVRRIENAKEQLAHKLGYRDVRELRQRMRENRDLIPRSGEQLLGLYRDFIGQMQAALPQMFRVGNLPPLEFCLFRRTTKALRRRQNTCKDRPMEPARGFFLSTQAICRNERLSV